MKRSSRESQPVVLLDLDGTLINTKRLYMEAYREAVLPYIGRELGRDEIMALRPRCELQFLRDVVGAERLEPCLADFHRAYEALHTEHFGGIYQGVPELLAGLRDASLRLGIVTGKSRRSWEVSLAETGLGEFDVLVFADDVAEPKPDPEGLRIALDTLGADPAGTYYLGDSITDMEAAAAAGVRPAAALWAWKPERRGEFLTGISGLDALTFSSPDEFLREVLIACGPSPSRPSPTGSV